MITLRFNQPLITSWPLVLRFEIEPTIPVPFAPPTIWAATRADFAKASVLQQTAQLAQQRKNPMSASQLLAWRSRIHQQSGAAAWQQSALWWSPWDVAWQSSALQALAIRTLSVKLVLHQSGWSWRFSKPVLQHAHWHLRYQRTPIAAADFRQQWQISAPIDVGMQMPWLRAAPLAMPYLLHYGPTPSRWSCSSDYRPQLGKARLRFSRPTIAGSNLQLRFEAAPVVCVYLPGGGYKGNVPSTPVIDTKIPIEPQIQRAYIMQPTIDCIRVRDNQRIVITAFSLSNSRGQYASAIRCDFSSKADADRARNELLKFSVNGYDFFGRIELFTQRDVFGGSVWSGVGRSRTAELSSNYQLPLSYTNATGRSFAGLLADLLLNTGWTINLAGVPDFTVPARAFSVGGKAPIDAVADAVAQLGLMLQADDLAKTLQVLPQYPTTPWLMASIQPDVVVHDAVIYEKQISDDLRPLCDCVFVRGEQVGVSARVKRNGTGGTKLAPDLTAALIVDVQAARMAGTTALANTGNKRIWQLTMPILVDLPPIKPGQLVGVRIGNDVFKTTADSMSVNAAVADTGSKDIWQTVSLIDHLE